MLSYAFSIFMGSGSYRSSMIGPEQNRTIWNTEFLNKLSLSGWIEFEWSTKDRPSRTRSSKWRSGSWGSDMTCHQSHSQLMCGGNTVSCVSPECWTRVHPTLRLIQWKCVTSIPKEVFCHCVKWRRSLLTALFIINSHWFKWFDRLN